ncbi:hypothetical protein HZH68_002112 [Vespula germanica]|uniref:Uncharacterized protein n=1 Tax=Vespula germanica TaxID=30212 RepID=A0A834KVA4_VESGE|nr:hypothetical protein HZH68_002112 [Vespula germanica]
MAKSTLWSLISHDYDYKSINRGWQNHSPVAIRTTTSPFNFNHINNNLRFVALPCNTDLGKLTIAALGLAIR